MKKGPITCWDCGKKANNTEIENVYGGVLFCCDKCKMDKKKK